jgi:hypothetical protein
MSAGLLGTKEPRQEPPIGRYTDRKMPMHFEAFSFGSIRIDGVTYEHDVVIDRGKGRSRNKKVSRRRRTRSST